MLERYPRIEYRIELYQWVMSRQITLLADDGNTQGQTGETSTAKNVTWFHGLGGGNFFPNSATLPTGAPLVGLPGISMWGRLYQSRN